MGAVTHSFHKNARRAESLTHVGVVQHVKSFCITKPWPIIAKVCQNHSWSKKALKDIFHLITIGLRRSSSTIPSSRTGTSCNTCRSAVRHPRSSAIRWSDNQPGLEKVLNLVHTVQVLGSVALERPWIALGLLACRMFGGRSLACCLRTETNIAWSGTFLWENN